MCDKLHEECGIFGIYGVPDVANITYFALHALQHRGQDGAGIVSSDGKNLHVHKGEGLVKDVFSNETHLAKCEGTSAIGHVRYATAGGGDPINIQPFCFRHSGGDFGLCHNGNIVNSQVLRLQLEKSSSIFQSSSDSEILAHLVKKDHRQNRLEAIKEALLLLEGAFAFLIITKDKLYAMRDKNGLRPLSLGKLDEGYVVSSETCAFDVIGAKFIRDIEPGEIITISKDGYSSTFYAQETADKLCAMEYIYFSRPDSNLEGINVHASRKACGVMLAKESPVDADIVVGVPDSSLSAASGFAETSRIPYEMGLIKNRYTARTFIKPSQELRERGVKMKLSPVRSIVQGKKVVLIDDSLVRGTTSKQIVAMLQDMGAKEVHMRIASPTIICPCFYGVATSTYEELISASMSVEEVRKAIGADSLEFLSIDGLKKAIGAKGLCLACFDSNYPTHLYDQLENANKQVK